MTLHKIRDVVLIFFLFATTQSLRRLFQLNNLYLKQDLKRYICAGNKTLLIDLNSVVGFKKCDENFLNGDFVDGMTIDSEDNLWIASYGSSKVCKFNTVDGRLLETVELPVKTVTSLCFGGDNWNEIYVTSYWDVSWITDAKPFDADHQYGKLYKISSDTGKLKGRPMYRWRSK